MLIAVLLTLLSVLCVFEMLGPVFIYASRPLMAGTLAGLVTGHVARGMAVGATLELAVMAVGRYWDMLLLAYVLCACLTVRLLGIALAGLAFAAMFMTLRRDRDPDAPQQTEIAEVAAAEQSALTRGDLRRSFWRFLL